MANLDAALRARRPTAGWREFLPKSFTLLRAGYGLADLRGDLVAGLTVAVVAVPLAMALAIASGATPAQGLLTAAVAGFLISALGGSRVQVGGPTGAFVVVVFNIIQAHGYDGLLLATLMAGGILIVAGIARLGSWICYVPEPVVTGFTAGIAVIIFSSQVRDLLGLSMRQVPADFIAKWASFWAARGTVSLPAVLLAAGALAVILLLRKYAPRWPAFLIAVVAASAAAFLLHMPVETIGSRFGAAAMSFHAPAVPHFSLEQARALLPSAFTIAFLAGVESLLSAVVADGMTGGRHRSNAELVAQGVANTASALFGGLPATGAIARTATNVRAGGRTPAAGMAHAVFVLAFMLVGGPAIRMVPMAALAAILVVVAWNMSESDRLRRLLRAPMGDRVVLLATFGLTVLVDLTVAIEVGVVLAAVVFMHRMTQVVAIEPVGDDACDDGVQRIGLPAGVEVFEVSGPLFFGAASSLGEVLSAVFHGLGRPPKAFILRLGATPLIDATGASVLRDFIERCAEHKMRVILSELPAGPARTLAAMKLGPESGLVSYAATYADALDQARRAAA